MGTLREGGWRGKNEWVVCGHLCIWCQRKKWVNVKMDCQRNDWRWKMDSEKWMDTCDFPVICRAE